MLLINRGGLNEKVTHYEEGSVIGIREMVLRPFNAIQQKRKGYLKLKEEAAILPKQRRQQGQQGSGSKRRRAKKRARKPLKRQQRLLKQWTKL